MKASRDQLRALVDALPDDAVDRALLLLTRLEDDEPLSEIEIQNLEAGISDVREGRMTPVDEYERQRRL